MPEQIVNYIQIQKTYLAAVEEELAKGIRRTALDGLDALHGMLTYHMGWEGEGAGPEAQGKRIRPLLVLFSCAAAGGDWKHALPAASAVELIHNFSLIHDDIEDNSPLRRGRPTLWKLWGIPQAVNAGDALFTLAHLEILQLREKVSPITTILAAEILQNTCLNLTQGQYFDLSYEQRIDLKLDDYWLMVSGKTAALISASAHLGALIAGADIVHQTHYCEFGRCLGLAFQVQDDLLGIWGDAELTGKSSTSDLVVGKKTLPVVYGLSQKRNFSKRWFQQEISPGEVPEIARLLEEEGAREYCEQASTQLTKQALDALESAQPTGIAGAALRQLTENLLGRKT